MAIVKNNQLVTLATTEVNYDLTGDIDSDAGITTLFITLVSGDVQAAVGPKTPPTAVIDDAGTYATWSTAGDRFPISLDPGINNLRMKCTSSGVVKVNW